jgi:hypothetical protein
MAKQKLFTAVGQVFGNLTVVELAGIYSICRCVCGNSTRVQNHRLFSGNTKSCGCMKKSVLGESRRIHGRSNSRIVGYADRTYGIWQAMKDRCNNPNRRDFHRYGGRGIYVCKEWNASFEAFVNDMGNAPKAMTIDRIDVNKGYEKSNCRWATLAEQAENQRKCIKYTVNGVTKTVSGWAREWGLWWAQAKRKLDETGGVRQ